MTADYNHLRTVKLPFLDWLKKLVAYRILSNISESNLKSRGAPIAVFANDYISNYICTEVFYEKLLLDNIISFLDPLKDQMKQWQFLDSRNFALEPKLQLYEPPGGRNRCRSWIS